MIIAQLKYKNKELEEECELLRGLVFIAKSKGYNHMWVKNTHINIVGNNEKQISFFECIYWILLSLLCEFMHNKKEFFAPQLLTNKPWSAIITYNILCGTMIYYNVLWVMEVI